MWIWPVDFCMTTTTYTPSPAKRFDLSLFEAKCLGLVEVKNDLDSFADF